MSSSYRGVPDGPLTYTGHKVLDEAGNEIGKVSDVIYEATTPKWLVVDVGLLGVSHYAPAALTFQTESGDVVASFSKDVVKRAPKAHRDHIVSLETEAQLQDHYALY